MAGKYRFIGGFRFGVNVKQANLFQQKSGVFFQVEHRARPLHKEQVEKTQIRRKGMAVGKHLRVGFQPVDIMVFLLGPHQRAQVDNALGRLRLIFIGQAPSQRPAEQFENFFNGGQVQFHQGVKTPAKQGHQIVFVVFEVGRRAIGRFQGFPMVALPVGVVYHLYPVGRTALKGFGVLHGHRQDLPAVGAQKNHPVAVGLFFEMVMNLKSDFTGVPKGNHMADVGKIGRMQQDALHGYNFLDSAVKLRKAL